MKELCEDYIHEIIKLNPTMNDFIKLKKYNNLRHKMPDYYSEKFYEKEEKINKKYYDILKKKKCKTFYDKLLFDELSDYYKTNYFEDEYYPLSHLDNDFIELMVSINSDDNSYEFNDVDSYKDYMNRLKKCKSFCNEIIKSFQKGIKKKRTLPRIITQSIIQQLQEIIVENTYENKYNHPNKIPKSIEKSFLDCIEKNLIYSIKRLLNFLIDEYVDHCRTTVGLCHIPYGKKLYENIVKTYAYKDYNSEIVHKLGISEINKNIKKINNLKKKRKFKGDYSEFIFHMKNNKSSQIKNKKDIIPYIVSLNKRILTEIFSKKFDEKIEKKDYYNIELVPKERDHNTAYYQLPDINGDENGTYYLNPLNANKHELYILTLHEGIPGHHYETMKNLRSDKPLYYKLCSFTSYVEGWGLYCESLAEPKNDYELFWQIIYDLHRSIRLVIDTGIHYYGWSYEKSYQYMKKYLPFDNETIKNEIYRYISDPGQAICYKIGEQFIIDLRKKYFKKHKDDYKNFHKLFLEIGPCPLHMVEEKFNEYLF